MSKPLFGYRAGMMAERPSRQQMLERTLAAYHRTQYLEFANELERQLRLKASPRSQRAFGRIGALWRSIISGGWE